MKSKNSNVWNEIFFKLCNQFKVTTISLTDVTNNERFFFMLNNRLQSILSIKFSDVDDTIDTSKICQR